MLISNTIPEAGPDGDKLGPHFRRLEALSEPIQTRMETSAVTSADASNTIPGDSKLLGRAHSVGGDLGSLTEAKGCIGTWNAGRAFGCG